MSLQITKTVSTGVVANYWVLKGLTYSNALNTLSVDMTLYVDKASKQAGKDAIATFTFSIPQISNADMDAIWVSGAGSTTPGIYTFLKTRPEFLNALDA